MDQTNQDQILDSAVAEGGAYEIIRKRLDDQGKQLTTLTTNLNKARLEEFGSSDMAVAGRVRVRTEHNCIARDMVQVGEHLLFGYNVFIGLKKETKVEDVFALFDVVEKDGQYDIQPANMDQSFLKGSQFVADFEELYRYYKHTKLIELSIKDGKLLAGFQIGEKLSDLRVFRWSISPDGQTITYIDNRGERDLKLPPAFDFEWIETDREHSVHGKHPHINIADKVFVETVGGDLTIKIENNTENGQGIYSESVVDKTQSLDDADVFYAEVGVLVLLKIKPYREEEWRYLIYNTHTKEVIRQDAIGQSCVQLPEDHGIVFPGGYYLQTGETKSFDEQQQTFRFQKKIKSPNGEDILYVFYEPLEGQVGLFAYNMIEKTLQNPIYGHGYALAENGQLIIFSAETEATRVHPMQIWKTPYVSDLFASQIPPSNTFYGRIGNSELVRGISDLYSVAKMLDQQKVSAKLYESISEQAKKLFDDHYWFEKDELKDLAEVIRQVSATAELVIDEFEKVESIRRKSDQAMAEAVKDQKELISSIQPDNWELAEQYVDALNKLRHQRGHLVTIKEYRYIDTQQIETLDQELDDASNSLSEKTVEFLTQEQALEPYQQKIQTFETDIEQATNIASLTPIIEAVDATAQGLDLLSELLATLNVADATVRTRIIDSISEVYGKLNQTKAHGKHKQKSLGSKEAVAQFSAQFKLFSQSITNALGSSTTPEKCDEQLSRLLVQLEELESQFSDYDEFLTDIMEKREEVYDSFESHKQTLLDERQRRAQSLADSADRMLASIEKRTQKFTEADDLNTYFASDPLVLKIKELSDQLRDLDAAIKADDLDARFKAAKEQGLRALRDKSDIYEEGGNVIKLGPKHKFSVNTQELDLTIIPRNGELNFHLTGTNYFEAITHPELVALKPFWDMTLESETDEVYRGEFLAYQIWQSALQGENVLTIDRLKEALLDDKELNSLVKEFAAPRYKEGYEKGIHDHDAALILKQLLPALDHVDLLQFSPLSRGIAQVFWGNVKGLTVEQSNQQLNIAGVPAHWLERAKTVLLMNNELGSNKGMTLLAEEINGALVEFLKAETIEIDKTSIRSAADYLVQELGQERPHFIASKYSQQLLLDFKSAISDGSWRQFQSALAKLKGQPAARWHLTESWLQAVVEARGLDSLARYIPETIGLINVEERIERRASEADLAIKVESLMGEHGLIKDRALELTIDHYLARMKRHQQEVIPAYKQYLNVRHQISVDERKRLKLDSFKAKPLSSFVRNRLINESYLPLIGDNLAKQMGTLGDSKRTDLMGLLMMISPPGYGKTTLMEYVANRLGLIFMKINCPSVGHDVVSLDPEQASNSTAAQELQKLNLALEMGNNVMLYLDDIQHTNPEFLQKFISLCDGTRRIEGVWKGETKTYDMRGKKFCVVMAGNPYTETGEAFTIPDMLANRADIYNLGDILGGMDEQFALSYIENAMTSNPVLAPLALREMDDIYRLIKLAQGQDVATNEMSHSYSGAELEEITNILKKMFVIQDVVLKINKQYIASAAQNDQYRVEPAFKLQGSYRNMNKMTEKISAVMNQKELMQMIADHYLGEAQLLTTGAEDNLLKLAELRGNMTEEQSARWQEIKRDFMRNKAMGGDEGDVGNKIVAQLVDLVGQVGELKNASIAANETPENEEPDSAELIVEQFKHHQKAVIHELRKMVTVLDKTKPEVKVVVPGMGKILTTMADTLEHSLKPVVTSIDQQLGLTKTQSNNLSKIATQLRSLNSEHKQLNKPAEDE